MEPGLWIVEDMVKLDQVLSTFDVLLIISVTDLSAFQRDFRLNNENQNNGLRNQNQTEENEERD